MNFYEAQEFFKKMYKDVLVIFEFDDQCIRQIECIYTDSALHIHNHVEYNKVKVSAPGVDPVYVPISPHRMIISSAQLKKKLSADDVHVHHDDLKELHELMSKNDPLGNDKLSEMSKLSGLSSDQIQAKMALMKFA